VQILAAKQIQARWRGQIARKNLRGKESAVLQLQALFFGMQARRAENNEGTNKGEAASDAGTGDEATDDVTAEPTSDGPLSSDDSYNAVAAQLQAKQATAAEVSGAPDSENGAGDTDDQAEAKAATAIQAGWKGRQARKQQQEKEDAVLLLQAMWAGKQAADGADGAGSADVVEDAADAADATEMLAATDDDVVIAEDEDENKDNDISEIDTLDTLGSNLGVSQVSINDMENDPPTNDDFAATADLAEGAASDLEDSAQRPDATDTVAREEDGSADSMPLKGKANALRADPDSATTLLTVLSDDGHLSAKLLKTYLKEDVKVDVSIEVVQRAINNVDNGEILHGDQMPSIMDQLAVEVSKLAPVGDA